MADKKKILEILKQTYCRLEASKIEGVGVFAIRNIPKGVNPFYSGETQEWEEFDVSEFKDLSLELMKMIDDFFIIEDGKVYVPETGLNGMDLSFFLNNSNNPNVETCDGGFSFITLRDIKKGEELTVKYSTYDSKWK
ncbi:MAG: SET domain-containing protein [Nanoarchaeota archaeon]|nr:SET domain-containing protein [Nanoarchaeota archaeon]